MEWGFNTNRYDSCKQNYIDAHTLLEMVCNRGEATPKDLAESRRRENVIRIQCRRLETYGLLACVGYETYSLTSDGVEYLEQGTVTIPPMDDTEDKKGKNWRIVDFDQLDPDVFKALNEGEFFSNPDNDYGFVDGDRNKTRQRIQNVKDYRINRVIREFPRHETAPKQCAHWVRAIVGLHFFPDANHRTAMSTLSFLLDINNIEYDEWPGSDIERAVLRSKLIRILLVDVRFDNLWEEDELFVHWHRYFRNLLCDVSNRSNRDHTVDELRQMLQKVRELKTAF